MLVQFENGFAIVTSSVSKQVGAVSMSDADNCCQNRLLDDAREGATVRGNESFNINKF